MRKGTPCHEVESKVELTDVLPTALDLAGIQQNSTVERRIEGLDMRPLIDGEEKVLHKFSYTTVPFSVRNRSLIYINRGNSDMANLYRTDNGDMKRLDDQDLINTMKQNLEDWRTSELIKSSEIYGFKTSVKTDL